MKELQYFKNSGNPEISVALAGINRLEWECATTTESIEISIKKMANGRFDILPIVEGDGNVVQCYKTIEWSNYDKNNIKTHKISLNDRLYYLTHIHDAIIKFAKTDRKFFFLDNQMEIIGLITIGNLNCKHVYLYLYNLVIQLEHAMGAYVYKNGIADSAIITLFELRTESGNAKNALMRYREDDAKGLDYNFIEYLYLTDLCFIFKKFCLIENIDMKKDEFMSIISKVNDIRTVVAHPNKSIIRNEQSIHDLYSTICGIDTLIDKLK